MNYKAVLVLVALSWLNLSLPRLVSAIDPGRVQGSLQVNGQAIALTQAYAHLHDNAEGLLDRPRELRLLLTDREVPQVSLSGISPLTALARLARAGRLQGLLLILDPKDPRHLELTLLSPPLAAGPELITCIILNNDLKSALELKIHAQRLGGTFICPPEPQLEAPGRPILACSLRFSAPVFHEPAVTAVLKGRAAQTSPQIQVLRAKVRALEQGDVAAVQRLSTSRAPLETRTLPAPAGPDTAAWAKQEAAKLQASLKHLQRVVVRSNRAVAVFANKPWQTFIREGGEWKIDN